MKRYTIELITLLLIVGCSQKPVDETTLIEKDGVMYLPNSDKPYTGEVFINYDTGEKLYQGTYENGLLIQYSYLNEDGSVKEPINYETSLVEREGMFYTNDTNEPYSGPVISLYEDGKKKDEGSMKDGKMVSYKEFEWHENGQKSREATFKYGELHGLVTEWHENGQKWREGTVNHGELDGLYTEWHENGQKFREETYKDGKEVGLSLQWHDNGQKEWEITYKDGKEVGLRTGWYENGKKKYEGNSKDGERDGLVTMWYENGQKEWEITFKDGERDGLVTKWYEDGQKEEEATYKDGELISEECWDEDGNDCECTKYGTGCK